ncbi:phage terminase small subunit [Candidatus Fukatsuia endosymbiont of Tuberolachnus salignus]|uniref:phage terminase small subunit n=1 Tax=Candidatus Fukatsuia endosymbiont of Tuberolachnus salignus TaxID=3077957 RepID=UPI00313CB7D7
MSNPVRRHKQFVAAQQAASSRETAGLRHASTYDLLLFKLQQDLLHLKSIASISRKAEVKRSLLPTYSPWVAGVLANGTGTQDAILMRTLIWQLDVGDLTRALDIADYAIKHDLATPDSFQRSTACLIAEEVAALASRTLLEKRPLDTVQLLRAQHLLHGQDMPDPVKARLHKMVGYALRQDGKYDPACLHLKQALTLDSRSGVKTDIKQLEKLLHAA